VRRDAGDTAYLSVSQSIFKLSVEGDRLIEYQQGDKVWETRLPFTVRRISVGQGVRVKEKKVTLPEGTCMNGRLSKNGRSCPKAWKMS